MPLRDAPKSPHLSRQLFVLAMMFGLSSCMADRSDTVVVPELPDPAPEIVAVGPETQVTTDPLDQFDPAISGSLVVYSDRRGAHADVWVHDVVTDVAAPVSGVPDGDQLLSDVSGNVVVFTDYGTGQATIWACKWNGSACPAELVVDQPGNQRRPAVFGSLIVYEDDRNENYDIYLYDMDTGVETQITDDPSHQRKPDIFGNRIVWEDYRNGNADVYTCEWDGAQCANEPVTLDPAQDVDPAVFGDWVAFGSNRASIGDIWAVNLAEGTTPIPVTSGEDYERNPDVSGTYVAYETYEAGDSNINLYDLATGTDWILTVDPAEQYLHAISGTRVVFTDNRNDNLDIYMVELTEGDVPAVDVIQDAVDGFVDNGSISNHGIGNALHAFLDQIASAMDAGDTASACQRLDHFIDFVTSKSGKQISADAAATLIGLAEELAQEACGP